MSEFLLHAGGIILTTCHHAHYPAQDSEDPVPPGALDRGLVEPEMNDYEVTVTVTDDDNSASVSVTDVTETAELSLTAPSTLTVVENFAYSATPTRTGTPIGTVTWSLAGTDAGDFTINAATGARSSRMRRRGGCAHRLTRWRESC